MYQLDRTACSEVEDKSGADIPIANRLDWITECRKGAHGDAQMRDLPKYLERGVGQMPWIELSQKDFLDYVVPYPVISDEELLKQSVSLMEAVVACPDRLKRSLYHYNLAKTMEANNIERVQTPMGSPSLARKALSRTNSLRRSVKEVKLRNTGVMPGSRSSSRPTSFISSG